MYVNDNNVTFCDSPGVEDNPIEIKKRIGNKNIITNIYRIPAYDSLMGGYFCIGLIDLMLKGKSFPDYTNLFSSNDYKKNGKTILKHFQ